VRVLDSCNVSPMETFLRLRVWAFVFGCAICFCVHDNLHAKDSNDSAADGGRERGADVTLILEILKN
jgi:hypothetical protein